ncbi:hypothetical protein [Bradyrhizobium sp. sGM-13]|uniref:hypothetical protein n=1 Tax=Bradyrhizobium sp. sGM-13 TaxID=2831781 RepID=UPI001BCF310F|nr:hypothetical protein [Bradyrhizobium sp. sGM-13]
MTASLQGTPFLAVSLSGEALCGFAQGNSKRRGGAAKPTVPRRTLGVTRAQ